MSIQIVMMLPPVAASVPLARHTLAEALRIADVAPDCVHEAQVALSEACTNVYHHAPAGQNFEVLINVGELELTMHILDAGPGFPHGHLAGWPDDTSENGRGMALMTAFADQAAFNTRDGGSVRLKKTLRRNPAPGPRREGWTLAAGPEERTHKRGANERDRVADERDRIAAERDRMADERDRIAEERDRASVQRSKAQRSSPDQGSEERTERAQAAQERQHASEARDRAASARDHAADQRDAAGKRDLAADQRDRKADRRDREADQRERRADRHEAEADQRERNQAAVLAALDTVENDAAIEVLIERADQRDHRAEQRDRRAEERDSLAALRGCDDEDAHIDRASAARDRELAAQDRDRAAGDRADLRDAYQQGRRHPRTAEPEQRPDQPRVRDDAQHQPD